MGLFQRSTNREKWEKQLDKVLYKVPGTDTKITWSDALEGAIIFGETGCGKTSGPGDYIAKSMLNAGWGILIIAAKADDKPRWIKIIEQCGRSKDLIVFDKASDFKFSYLRYEMTRPGEGRGDIYNANKVLVSLNKLAQNYDDGGGRDNKEQFWDDSLKRLISCLINTLQLVGEEVNIKNMRRLVSEAFTLEEARHYENLVETIETDKKIDPVKRKKATEELGKLISSSFFVRNFTKIRITKFNNEELQDDADEAKEYWLHDFAKISERTRSIIAESFKGITNHFTNRGILKRQFSKGLSPEVVPENIIANNQILLLDFNLKEFRMAGVLASIIYKTAFQQAIERRQIDLEKDAKPFGLFIDEYSNYINSQMDPAMQSTARSAGLASVFLTQNINGLIHAMGDKNPEAGVKSLLGNLNLKYFGANSNFDTNQYASAMVGQHLVDMDNLSISKGHTYSKTKNQQLMPRVLPSEFTTFKTGRKANNYKVEMLVFKAGKTWGANENYAIVEFDQKK